MNSSESRAAQIEVAKRRINQDGQIKEGLRVYLEQELDKARCKAAEANEVRDVRRFQGEVQALTRVLKSLVEVKPQQ